MNTKKRFWLALVIFGLLGQVAWVVENMYFNVFIYNMFKASPADIASMVSASAIAATVTTIIMGALADKLGKRKMFICFGYIAWGISILLFALIRVDIIQSLFPALTVVSASAICILLVIIMDCVMTFFGSTANDAAFNAWLTDSTDDNNRGAAEGINSMMPLVAILVVFGGFMAFDLEKSSSWTLVFAIIGGLVIICGILGIFLIKDTGIKTVENNKFWANLIYGFRPSVIKANKSLYITLIAFAVFGISIQIFMPYLILYYSVSLQMDNYVLIMAPAIIVASVATAFYGRLYDRFKFTKTVIPAILILIGGYLLLFFFKSTALVFIGSLLMMSGYLCGMAVFGAMIREKTPENKSGMFQGLRICGQVLIPGVIGPEIGKAVLKNADVIINNDGTTSFIPNENIFIAATAVAVVIFIFIPFINKLIKKEKQYDI